MSKIAITTDSTAYIPKNMLKNLPIFSIPLHVVWGDESYNDGIDITSEEFYKRLKTEKEMPKTSQITPEEFKAFYQNLINDGYDKILGIHLSTKFTKTLDSAIQAAANFPNATIELIDSMTGAMAMGFHVLTAAKAAVMGATIDECKKLAEKARNYTNIYFIPGSLECLHRGGRIGGAAAFFGSVLQIKPILVTNNGYIDAFERIRTMKKAVDRLIEVVEKAVGNQSPIRLAALYSDIPELAEELLEKTIEKLGVDRVTEAFITGISPVLGTHIGPGSVGMAYMAGM